MSFGKSKKLESMKMILTKIYKIIEKALDNYNNLCYNNSTKERRNKMVLYRALIEMESGCCHLSKTYEYENEMYADLEVQGYTEDCESIRKIEYHKLVNGKIERTWQFSD